MSHYTSALELLKREVWAAAHDGQASKIVSLLRHVGSRAEKILNHRTEVAGSLTTPLICAVSKGNEEVVAVLLRNFGFDLERKGTVIYKNNTYHGVTALWCASCSDNYNIVKILVENGANVNNPSYDGSSPLAWACFYRQLKIVQFLVEHGADVNTADQYETTCLMYACKSGNYYVVKHLLEMGADPLRKSLNGKTALHFSADGDDVAISHLLVAAGLKLNKDNYGRTPLMLAALRGQIDAVEYFISLKECCREDHVDALELLGTSFLFIKNPDFVNAYDYFDKAMYERYKLQNQIVSKQLVPTSSILAITEKEECTNLDELEEIREDELALCIEGIHIRERVLGTRAPDLPIPLFHTGSLFAGNGDYETCIDLWTNASNLTQNIGKEFDVSRFSELFTEMLQNGLAINFRSVLTCFQSVENELKLNTIRMKSNEGKYKIIYETCFLTCIYLIGIMLQTFTSKEEEHQLNRAVYSFIKMKPLLTNGCTPIHICCGSATKDYDIDLKNEILFPNIRLCKVLVACGASVNAQDGNNNTPLHVVAKCNNFDSNILSEIILCLLENGAHLDACNKDGKTAADAATNCIAASIIKTHVHLSLLSLKCLSARAVRKYKMEFEGIIPDSLKEFVELH